MQPRRDSWKFRDGRGIDSESSFGERVASACVLRAPAFTRRVFTRRQPLARDAVSLLDARASACVKYAGELSELYEETVRASERTVADFR